MAENKKILTVTQQVKELVYDIQNKAYLTGQAREAEGKKNYEAASNMQASDDEENSYQIRRSLANAFSSLKSLLGDGVLELAFELPSNYNNSSADALGNGIHAYLVDMALGDWFAITNPEDAASYVQHSAISLENVKRALYKRSRPERPTYS